MNLDEVLLRMTAAVLWMAALTMPGSVGTLRVVAYSVGPRRAVACSVGPRRSVVCSVADVAVVYAVPLELEEMV